MYVSNMLAALIVICLFLVLPFLTVKSCVADARRRGKSPLLVTLLVFFFFPLGLILWLLSRPEPTDGSGRDHRFCLDDYRVQ
jgi:predicted membrane metal-binding protein